MRGGTGGAQFRASLADVKGQLNPEIGPGYHLGLGIARESATLKI
jgi:hypothetical protein